MEILIHNLFDFFKHECYEEDSLSGENRRVNLESIKKVRNLKKIDRICFYNLISFNDCYYKIKFIDRYLEDAELVDLKQKAGQLSLKQVECFEETNKCDCSL